MAATKYQVMYRLVNDVTGTPITNDPDTVYEPTTEFYVDPDHRIFFDDEQAQIEEIEKQQKMIISANSADNPKQDMLFVYNGTARVPHAKYYEEIGYVVRDYKLVLRSDIGDEGDFSKLFTTINGKTCEDGGLVVCSQRNILAAAKKYPYTINFNDGKHWNFKGSILVTTSDEIQADFINSSVFKLADENWTAHTTKGREYSLNYIGTSIAFCGPIFVDCVPSWRSFRPYGSSYNTNAWCIINDVTIGGDTVMAYGNLSRGINDIETVNIPGHYEEVVDAPYLIKDQYKRIENSPWVLNCTVGSLEAALTKAKKLVEMIGIDNVKVIKVVPFDQFIKIN